MTSPAGKDSRAGHSARGHISMQWRVPLCSALPWNQYAGESSQWSCPSSCPVHYAGELVLPPSLGRQVDVVERADIDQLSDERERGKIAGKAVFLYMSTLQRRLGFLCPSPCVFLGDKGSGELLQTRHGDGHTPANPALAGYPRNSSQNATT